MENKHDDRDHDQDVNEPAGDVKGETADPEQQQKNRDSQEHTCVSVLDLPARVRRATKCKRVKRQCDKG